MLSKNSQHAGFALIERFDFAHCKLPVVRPFDRSTGSRQAKLPSGLSLRVEDRASKCKREAFALIELLVVIAILALLVSILLPSLSSAKELAKVVRVKAELRGIATALECYAEENERTYPPQRTYCEIEKWEHFCELPIELVEGKWLTAGQPDTKMSANIEDIFNPGHTYKYKAPGWGFHNNGAVPKSVWVPDDFPNDDPDADPQTLAGQSYDNVWVPTDADGKIIPCPINWVIWSVGPRYDPDIGVPPRAPVARCSWYRGSGTEGVITCVRTTDGQMHMSQ